MIKTPAASGEVLDPNGNKEPRRSGVLSGKMSSVVAAVYDRRTKSESIGSPATVIDRYKLRRIYPKRLKSCILRSLG